MANTQPARFSFSAVDELGTEASETYYAMVDPAMTIAQFKAAWTGTAAVLDPIMGAQITHGSAVVLAPMVGGKIAPVAGARIEQTGVFNFKNDVTTHRFGEPVAGLADSVIVGGKINLADAGVVAYLAWLGALLAGGGFWSNTAQQQLNGLQDAFISFRKRRKSLTRSSFEL